MEAIMRNTIDWEVNINRLNKVCEILEMDNPLLDKEDMLISEVPMMMLYKLIKLSKAIRAKDDYETEHSDFFGMWDYGDLFFEAGVDVNTLISKIDEHIRNNEDSRR
jgi:hypothetical protein